MGLAKERLFENREHNHCSSRSGIVHKYARKAVYEMCLLYVEFVAWKMRQWHTLSQNVPSWHKRSIRIRGIVMWPKKFTESCVKSGEL